MVIRLVSRLSPSSLLSPVLPKARNAGSRQFQQDIIFADNLFMFADNFFIIKNHFQIFANNISMLPKLFANIEYFWNSRCQHCRVSAGLLLTLRTPSPSLSPESCSPVSRSSADSCWSRRSTGPGTGLSPAIQGYQRLQIITPIKDDICQLIRKYLAGLACTFRSYHTEIPTVSV